MQEPDEDQVTLSMPARISGGNCTGSAIQFGMDLASFGAGKFIAGQLGRGLYHGEGSYFEMLGNRLGSVIFTGTQVITWGAAELGSLPGEC